VLIDRVICCWARFSVLDLRRFSNQRSNFLVAKI